MQNIPLPNQAAMLSNTAVNATNAKTGKQANAANDGPPFREVLAKQIKQEGKDVAAEQVLQRQRLQLQLRAGEEALMLNPGLIKPELVEEMDIGLDDALVLVEDFPQDALDISASTVLDTLPVDVEAQVALANVTSDVQQRKLVPQIEEELDAVNVKREPLEWNGKGKEQAQDAALDKLATQATQTQMPKVDADNEPSAKFAESLQQVAQHVVPTPVATPTSLPQATATIDVRGNTIPTPFGQTGWNQAIGQKVVWMAAGGEQTASLTLNPPDLGPLQVIIHVHNNQADTTFLSDQADVRRALEDGMDNLRQMMSESGLQLGQANVRSGQQEAQQQQGGNMARMSTNAQETGTNDVLAKAAKVMGLVDTFA